MKYFVLLSTAFLLFVISTTSIAISRPDSTNNSSKEMIDPNLVLEKYLDEDEDNADANYYLGMTYYKLGDLD